MSRLRLRKLTSPHTFPAIPFVDSFRIAEHPT
jgi:hypothetical protein